MKYSARLLEEIEAVNQQIALTRAEIGRLKREEGDKPETEGALAKHREALEKLRALRDGKWWLRGSVMKSEKELAVRERKRKRAEGLRKVKLEGKKPKQKK